MEEIFFFKLVLIYFKLIFYLLNQVSMFICLSRDVNIEKHYSRKMSLATDGL